MAPPLDAGRVIEQGWRQGAVLGSRLAKLARQYAPKAIPVEADDAFIVTSHDCDVTNGSLDREPFVEIIRARPLGGGGEKQFASGRHPRTLHLPPGDCGGRALALSIHDRWLLPRELLAGEPPAWQLPDGVRRLLARWLASRYIRPAFPTAFDQRWRRNIKAWVKLLRKHSGMVQGIYLRLNTRDELDDAAAYRCSVLVAVPGDLPGGPDWPERRAALEDDVEAFWSQFEPRIVCDGVDVRATRDVTLSDLEDFQRFDADWVSHDDGTPLTPEEADLER